MSTREEIMSHLREMLEMEEKADRLYYEIAESVNNPALKEFFAKMAKEEEVHGKIVNEMMEIAGRS